MNHPVRWSSVLVAAAISWRGIGLWHPAPAIADDQDKLVVENATATDAPIVVVHGQTTSDQCPDEAPLSGAGPQRITNVTPPSACLVTVFSNAHAVSEIAPSWTVGADSVPLQLGGSRLDIKLSVYVATGDDRAVKWARADMTRARQLYNRNRAGITFSEAKLIPFSALTSAEVAAIGDDCSTVDKLKATPSVFDGNKMNVYYVDKIRESTPRGYNCFKPSDGNSAGATNVIYISMNWRSPTTLTHELGHAFGLQGPTGHTGQAHVAKPMIAGFTLVNIMWDRLETDEAKAQNQFSLGQAYRMNADDNSWLHLMTAEMPGALPTRTCHPVGPTDPTPCPPLAFDLPAGVN